MTDYLRLAQERAQQTQGQDEQDNPYLPLAREQQLLQQNRARTVIEAALKDDPDLAAERLRLSQTSGLPLPVIERNLEELRVKERARAIDLVRLAEESPVLYRQLVDPTFAATSVDDLDTLKNLERSVGRGVAYVMGADGKGGLPKDLAGAAVDVGLGATAGVGEMIFNVAGTLYDLVGWQSGARDMRGLANRSKEARDALGFQPESSTGRAVKSGLQSSGTNLALLPLGLARGLWSTANQAAAAVAGTMATGVGADAYMRAREQGRTSVQSLTYAIPEAAFEYLFERIPASKLFGDIAANTGLLKTIGRQALSEGWTEQVTTLAQDFNEWMNLNPDKTLAEFINERPEAAYQTFIATLVGVGVQTSTIKAINKIVETASNQSLVYEQDLFQQQLQLAAASMLRARSPEQFRSHIQRVVDANDGAKKEIYVDAEVLNQLPPELLAQLPDSVREALPSALEANSTVAIPMADVLTVAPGTDLEQILNDHARMRPNAPSRAEAELTAQLLAQDAERVLKQAADTAAWQQSAQAVQQAILDQLNQTGRFTPDVNEAYATLQANFFSTMAARVGLTPQELYERYQLKVAAKSPGGQAYNADRGLTVEGRAADMPDQELEQGSVAAPTFETTYTDAQGERFNITLRREVLGMGADRQLSVIVEARTTDGNRRGMIDFAVQGNTLAAENTIVAPAYRRRGLAEAMYRAAREAGYDIMPGRKQTADGERMVARLREKGVINRERPLEQGGDVGAMANQSEGVALSADGLPETIEVDGVQRPTRNSAGQPIHPTEEGIRNFWRWFGDSKVVDANGKPLAVYRGEGSGEDFTVFDRRMTREKAFFFTPDRDIASTYAAKNNWSMTEPRSFYLKAEKLFDPRSKEGRAFIREWAKNWDEWIDRQSGEDIDPVDAVLEGRLFDYEGDWSAERWRDLQASIEAAGYDGARLPDWDNDRGTFDAIIVFRPEQIKSATGNRGTFDPADPNILKQGPRGTFNPEQLLITLNETADLSTFLHESGHFFLEVLADLASQPDAPQQIKDDMATTLKWFGVPDLETWNSYTLEQKRPYHERWAESFEQYLFEGKAPSQELQPLFRRFRSWLVNVYKSLKQFMQGRNLQLGDDIRQVFDRLIATDEQIAQAEEAAGMLPDFEATNEAIEKLQARSLRDLKWTVNARNKALKALQKQAAKLRKEVESEVRAEVEQQPIYRAMRWLKKGETVDPETGDLVKAEKGYRLSTAALAEMYPETMLGRPDLTRLRGMTSKEGLHPDLVADMFGFASGDQLVRALLDAQPINEVIEGMTDQRMLERYGDLATPEAREAAANEAVHNEARARALATELKSQAEMINQRLDTGRTDARGRPITVNAVVEAAKQFGLNLAARRRIKDLKNAAWQHRAAEGRAGKRWQQLTAEGKTVEAVQAKRDQLLNNYAAKALQDAQAEVKKTLEFFRKVTKGSDEKTVEKGRDPDVVNAMRAILAAYGVAPRLEKSALAYMETVAKNDPAMYAALKPSVDSALLNAKPLDELTLEELRGLNDELRAMWELAKRSRQMEVDGNLLDIEDAADELLARMEEIGIPTEIPGERAAITDREEAGIKLQFAKAILSRVEQWAERMDGKFGGPFLRLVFRPIKEAADAYRAARVDYRKRFTALVESVSHVIRPGEIPAPELGYTFGNARDSGQAELLHAILHTGNESNKRKLLLGRGWATEREDGTLDTSRWDAFIARMINEGKLEKAHYDFAQGVWDLLEEMKPRAQETHRKVFGRYFAEVTATPFDTPFGSYRGGYVPAQTDSRLVKDAKLRELAEAENESMAYAFPASPRGFTKARVEYNKPLLLDLRALAQHMDKVLLFSYMQGPVTDVRRLLTNKRVSYALDRIDPGAYEGMLIPWLNRAAKQIVETPVAGDRKLSRFLSAARSRAGMALMFANLSNTFQQITGFSLAAVKVKPSLMMKATASFIADPKAMKEQVATASAFMRNRMLNEVAAMNDAVEQILVNATVLEKAQAWTQRHAYFMQAAVDNTMSPIIWTAAYNQAIEQQMSHKDAVRFADGVIRQTQGTTLPEDISRFESGPAYARLFTQFVSYFNMMANTNATAMKQIVDEMGLRKGAGRLLYVALAGLLVPIWVAEAIALAFRGGPEDEDDDGYLDDWLMAVFGMGTLRGLTAQVPIVGQAAQLVVNRFNDNPADDKFSLSPAVSLLESAVSAPASVYKAIIDDGSAQKAVRDVAAAATLITGLPIYAAARPAGYLAGMADGRIEPTGPVDLARGLVTGTASPESRTP